MRVCWNRQTGKLEVLVSVWACGFDSRLAHHKKDIHSDVLFVFPLRAVLEIETYEKQDIREDVLFLQSDPQ